MYIAGECYHTLSSKRLEALERTDALPPELRECVHEFGLAIVTTLVKYGIRSPRAIREIVKEIWAGARQEGQRTDARNTIDWLLCQSGTGTSAKTFYRLLAENNMAVVTVEPTRAMLNASLAEVSGHTLRCTKEEKHRRRLRAALRAAMKPEQFNQLRTAS